MMCLPISYPDQPKITGLENRALPHDLLCDIISAKAQETEFQRV